MNDGALSGIGIGLLSGGAAFATAMAEIDWSNTDVPTLPTDTASFRQVLLNAARPGVAAIWIGCFGGLIGYALMPSVYGLWDCLRAWQDRLNAQSHVHRACVQKIQQSDLMASLIVREYWEDEREPLLRQHFDFELECVKDTLLKKLAEFSVGLALRDADAWFELLDEVQHSQLDAREKSVIYRRVIARHEKTFNKGPK